MKKRNNAFARLVGLLLVSATVLTLTVAATGGAGTSSDPLVLLKRKIPAADPFRGGQEDRLARADALE